MIIPTIDLQYITLDINIDGICTRPVVSCGNHLLDVNLQYVLIVLELETKIDGINSSRISVHAGAGAQKATQQWSNYSIHFLTLRICNARFGGTTIACIDWLADYSFFSVPFSQT